MMTRVTEGATAQQSVARAATVPGRAGQTRLMCSAIVAVTAVLIGWTGVAAAQEFDAARHFKGKSIRLVVDFKPGGGTDIQARYFASNWGKFIPGAPRMTVTNLFPNPAGRNFVWKSAPDGMTMSFLANSGIGDELVDSSAQFETDKFVQIGSHAKRDVVLIARDTVPYKSLVDAKGGKVTITVGEAIGSVDDISGKLMAIGMLSLWFDVPMRIATVARGGSSDALVMLERGDINGYLAGSHWYSLPTLRPGWFAKGYVKVLADLGHPESPSIPNGEIAMPVPNAYEWLSDEQKDLWKGMYLPDVLSGKGILAPPGMRPEIAEVLRDSYAKAVSDPEFAKGLEKLQGQPVALIHGDKLQQQVAEAQADFKKYLPRYNELRQKVYEKLVEGK